MAMKRCDCGAQYPDEAEYCPNCGRPLTAEALAQERADNAFVREAEPEEEAPNQLVSFGNPQALRASYWPAALAALLVSLKWFSMLCWIWYPAAGFLAVTSYHKRTGVRLDVTQGARLGWISGVITFTLSMILTALASVVGGGFGPALRQMQAQFREQGEADMADAMVKLADDPVMLASVIVVGLVLTFLFVTALTTLGGALGARVTRDD